MMHDEYARLKNHELITPTKAWVGQPTFTVDESAHTSNVGNKRIHVERAFKRAQEWKILHKVIPITRVDIWGAVFYVCCMMSNYGPPMIRDGVDGLPCVAEIQWGVRNEVGASVQLPCTPKQAEEIAAAHAEAATMSGHAAVLRANAAANAAGAQDAHVLVGGGGGVLTGGAAAGLPKGDGDNGSDGGGALIGGAAAGVLDGGGGDGSDGAAH
eukprot:SAG11_NODE_1746_length_4331_cov_2.793715_3_plen_213_part_00